MIFSGIAVLLIGFGAYVTLLNWFSPFSRMITGRFSSPVPLFGAIFLGAGMAILPSTRIYAWLAIFIDFFGTFMLLIALPFLLWQAWSHRQP